CTYLVTMIMEVLQLGQEQPNKDTANPVAPFTSVVDTSLSSLNQSEVVNKKKDKSNPLEKKAPPIPPPQTTSSNPSPTPTPVQTSPQSNSSSDDPNARKCSNSNCHNKETSEVKFMVCGNCKKGGVQVPYCSRSCQQKHWAQHKLQCL